MTTPQQPTLAEIVAGLRKEADGLSRLKQLFDKNLIEDPELEKTKALFTAAADRLEALAKLAGAVDYDMDDKSVFLDGVTVKDWFDARDRLTK